MLLDDVMSELDPDRRRRLVEMLELDGQALITATEPGHVPASQARELAIADGVATASEAVGERRRRRQAGAAQARGSARPAGRRSGAADAAGRGPGRLAGACGELIAANSEPVAERDGTVTIACATGAWAQELELMSDELLTRIGAVVGPDRVRRMRFTADLARHR